MKQRIIVTSEPLRNRAAAVCANMPFDKPHEVIIRPYKENRKLWQNSHMWDVETEIGKYLGYGKDEMHEVHKREFLVSIFIRDDPEYAEMWLAVENTPEPHRSHLERQVVKLTSTTRCNVEQMDEFNGEIERRAAELGVRLPYRERE